MCALCCIVYQIQKREQQTGIIRTIGAVLVCYAIGILASFVGGDWFDFTKKAKLMEASLLLSLPLLLLSTNLKSVGEKSSVLLKSFVTSLVSISISVFIIAAIFKDKLEELPMVMAGIESTYTGSTANLMSIHLALNMSEELFQLIFTGDFMVGAIYLFILLKISPSRDSHLPKNLAVTPTTITLHKTTTPKYLTISIVINLICIGLSFLLFQKIQSTFIILAITVLSTIFTHYYKSKSKQDGVLWGEYFLLLFCFL